MAADAETWETMPEDLQNFKVQFSAVTNLQSLENLCLAKVADTLDFHCKKTPANLEPQRRRPGRPLKRRKLSSATVEPPQYHEPFKDLPPVVMTSLQRILEEKQCKMSLRVLLCLISGNIVSLNVETLQWSKGEKEALLRHIRNRGQNISELDLSLGPQDSVGLTLLQSMMGVLTRLTVLNLQRPCCDKSILATIGSSCPELRHLDMSLSRTVNDKEVRYLYDGDLPRGANGEEYGKCKKLTYLNVEMCSVTTDGLVALLSNLPDLLCLKHDFCLYEAIVKFVQSNEAQLKLQYLYMNREIPEKMLRDTLASVISKARDIRKLRIDCKEIQNVDEFLKLEHVTDLTLYNLKNISTSQVTSLITNFSQQLTRLDLDLIDRRVDISVIGFHCHQLTELNWRVKCTTESKHKLDPSIHFKKLKNVFLNHQYHSDNTVPDDAMKCFLASPCLEKFKTSLPIPCSTLSWLVEEARVYGEVFSNLREFTLYGCTSVLRANQILCLAPKLKTLIVPQEAMKESVCDFMRQHGLHHCQVKKGMWYR